MIENILKREEGYNPKPYLCSEGYVTIGYGTKLHNVKGCNPDEFCLTVTEESGMALMMDEVTMIVRALSTGIYSSTFIQASPSRKDILVSMAYQLGVSGVYKFRKMWSAIAFGDYEKACYEMLDSLWAEQTPRRAQRHAHAMAADSLREYM